MPKKTFSRGTRDESEKSRSAKMGQLSPRVVIRTQGSLHFDRSRNQSNNKQDLRLACVPKYIQMTLNATGNI